MGKAVRAANDSALRWGWRAVLVILAMLALAGAADSYLFGVVPQRHPGRARALRPHPDGASGGRLRRGLCADAGLGHGAFHGAGGVNP